MSDMDANCFAAFWDCVRRNEEYISQYGHIGYDPNAAEGWDERFAECYAAIEAALRPVARPRMFAVPAYLPGKSAFQAATAHQAIMFFLNPPEALFGYGRALGSPEYLET